MSTFDYHHRGPNKWRARAQVDRRVYYLGNWPSKAAADAAEDRFWQAHGGRRHDTRRPPR